MKLAKTKINNPLKQITMVKSASKKPVNVNQQYNSIVAMLTEIENLQNDLLTINKNLLNATENTCSEYGDRILENMQNKLFYLQRVLKNNTKTLNEHESVLKKAIEGSLSKSKKELQDYYEYCEKSASFIRSKLEKYMNETKGIIANNC